MWRDFEAATIDTAPVRAGAYRLYRNARIIFVGMAAGRDTLRSELQRHLRGDFGRHTQSATEFDYREAEDRRAARRAYLDFYVTSGLRPR
jgi:hypothetical protein